VRTDQSGKVDLLPNDRVASDIEEELEVGYHGRCWKQEQQQRSRCRIVEQHTGNLREKYSVEEETLDGVQSTPRYVLAYKVPEL